MVQKYTKEKFIREQAKGKQNRKTRQAVKICCSKSNEHEKRIELNTNCNETIENVHQSWSCHQLDRRQQQQ